MGTQNSGEKTELGTNIFHGLLLPTSNADNYTSREFIYLFNDGCSHEVQMKSVYRLGGIPPTFA